MRLYLIRGLPGSGKSTYAKSLNCLHVEVDMYHVVDGNYTFSPARAKAAHDWCQGAVRAALSAGLDVAVADPFPSQWLMHPYMQMASEFGATVVIVRTTANYGNIHSIPADELQRMHEHFEDIPGELFVSPPLT